MKVKYYSGDVLLSSVYQERRARFLAIGGVTNKHNRVGSFDNMVGHPATGPDAVMPVTRVIFYKSNPSLHKCDSRCMNAKGNNCECSCGGANHGHGHYD